MDILSRRNSPVMYLICGNCVRFAPVICGSEQMRGMHGVNENTETACLPGAVGFYKALIGKNR